MATYFIDDFSSLTGWTKRWNTSPTWTGANPLQIPNGVLNDWIGISLDSIDSDGDRDDVELLVKFTTPSSIPSAHRIFMVRGSGADETPTHIHFSITSAVTSIGYCSGSDSRTNIASYSQTINTSTTYWARFRVNGTAIQSRCWADGAGEPGTWGVDTTDSNVSGVGWVAIGQGGGNIAGCTISQIGIGTNGDTAPASAGSGGIDGDLDQSLGAVTLSATGTLPIVGTLSQTLGAATLASTGTLGSSISGALDQTLGAVTLSAAGTLPIVGALGQSLGALTLSSAGMLPVVGTASNTLGALTLSATGQSGSITTGALSATLGAATLAATGTLPISATLSQTLDALVASATGRLPIVGSSSLTLGALTIVATGSTGATITGTTSATLGALTLTATAYSGLAPMSAAPLVPRGAGPRRMAQLSSGRRTMPPNGRRL